MKNALLIPVLAGAAAAAVVAYFLLSEDTTELRDKLAEKLPGVFDSLKEKVIEKMTV
jgi:gas vesicle protein